MDHSAERALCWFVGMVSFATLCADTHARTLHWQYQLPFARCCYISWVTTPAYTEALKHCSLSATSICTLKHVRDYFREGKVPEAGVICETEDTLFEMNKETQDLSKGKNDYGFADAVRELSNAFEVPRFPGV